MTDSNNTDPNNWRSKQIWIKDVLSKSGTELMEIKRTTNPLNSTTSITKVPASITTTVIGVKNGGGRKVGRRTNGRDSPAKMVYYPSTPLIIKTEQPSQAQFCTPLRATTPTTTTAATSLPSGHQQLLSLNTQQHQQQHSITTLPQNYTISHNNETILLQHEKHSQHQQQHQQQQHQQQHQQTTGNNGYQLEQKPQSYLLTSIKTEHLPPSITVYATSSSSATATSMSMSSSATPPTLTTLTNVTMTPTPTPIPTPTPTATTTTGGGRKTAATTNNKPQFKCEQCGMTFGSKSAHTSHTKSHASNTKTLDMDVSAAGNITTTLGGPMIEVNEAGIPIGIPKVPQIVPIATTGGSDPYQCNVCQKTFAVPARLIRHYRTHTGERPFECEFCHKLFSVKENLQVHRRIHTKERPYKCDVCGRAFEHSGKLHRHMRIHTGERPHKCSVCEKTFIQSGQLVIHMRTHTGEKPYKCPVDGCGKGFTCSKQLKVHSRTHTGEKPYQCDICFRDFGYNHVLKLHRVQHYGSKCYKCTICDKTFKGKKEMEAHIKGHANEMPDDDEEIAAGSTVGSGQTSSFSSSGGETTNSAPGSPQSPSNSNSNSNAAIVAPPKTRKPRQARATRAAANNSNASSTNANVNLKQPLSPSSPSSTFSPPSSLASAASRLSASTPPSSAATSPDTLAVAASYTTVPTTNALNHETDMQYNCRDTNTHFVAASVHQQHNSNNTIIHGAGSPISYSNLEDLPTDLSIGQNHLDMKMVNFYQTSQQRLQQTSPPPSYTYLRQHTIATSSSSSLSPSPSSSSTPMSNESHTINPALLEAATIAREEEAALQIMQLHRQQHATAASSNAVQQIHPNAMFTGPSELSNHDDDSREANELIAHYKRGELGRHGLHKRYAPVPKFESSLRSNENLVRQVEAAIAPLRSSTESPERSSSPESDTIMLVSDRDVMTLPLRKRKLYMSEKQTENEDDSRTGSQLANGNTINGGNGTTDPKVMRMSSVIQFAKAS